MPLYDYRCQECDLIEEQYHSIKKDPVFKCPTCKTTMVRQVGLGVYVVTGGLNPSLADHKESEHTKKVTDKERAIKMRKKAFGHDSVGNPVGAADPRHVIRRGRTLGGQQKEVDKKEFIKAAAKDIVMVKKAQEALKK